MIDEIVMDDDDDSMETSFKTFFIQGDQTIFL